MLSCPPRNCYFREGPKWLEERLEHGRDAALHPRVDRRRVAFASLSATEGAAIRAAHRRLPELDRRARADGGRASRPRARLRPSGRPRRPRTLGRRGATCLTSGLPDLVRLRSPGRSRARHPARRRGSWRTCRSEHRPKRAALRLAVRTAAGKIEICRDVSVEDLAKLPIHMRQPRICEEQPVAYRVTLTVDGVVVHAVRAERRGMRSDRAAGRRRSGRDPGRPARPRREPRARSAAGNARRGRRRPAARRAPAERRAAAGTDRAGDLGGRAPASRFGSSRNQNAARPTGPCSPNGSSAVQSSDRVPSAFSS